MPLFLNSDVAVKLEGRACLHDRVEQLFREARDDVYYYILSFGLAAPEAQDLTQDVFLRFYVAARGGDDIESPRGWLFRTAHNLAVNAIRRRNTHRLFTASSRQSEVDGEESPERGLIRKQAANRIRNAVGTLSPREKLCLRLRAEGLRYSEIGRTTGLAVSTVGEFVSRAIRKLRKALHE